MRRTSITDDEFTKFASRINLRCKVLRIAHASLYLSTNKIWKYLDTGLAVLIKDNERRNYYLQFFKLDKFKLLCEFEILWNCKYEKSQNNLYKFYGEKELVNLTFDDKEEASKFELEIQEIIKNRNARMRGRKDNPTQTEINKRGIGSSEIRQYINMNMQSKILISDKKQNDRKSSILKNEISYPYNFQHLDHLGLDGYFFETPNEELFNHFIDLTKKSRSQIKLTNTNKPNEIANRIAPSRPKSPKDNPPKPPLRQQVSQQVPNSSTFTNIPKRPNTPQGNKSSFPLSLSSSPSISISPLSSGCTSSKSKMSNTDSSESNAVLNNENEILDFKKSEIVEPTISKYESKEVSCCGDTEQGLFLNALSTYFGHMYNIREANNDSNSDSDGPL